MIETEHWLLSFCVFLQDSELSSSEWERSDDDIESEKKDGKFKRL